MTHYTPEYPKTRCGWPVRVAEWRETTHCYCVICGTSRDQTKNGEVTYCDCYNCEGHESAPFCSICGTVNPSYIEAPAMYFAVLTDPDLKFLEHVRTVISLQKVGIPTSDNRAIRFNRLQGSPA